MRIAVAALVGIAVVAGCGGGSPQVPTAPDSGGQASASQRVSSACSATRVQGSVVRAGPFVGQIAGDYDVLDGRFRLRVGKYRDADIGLTQKIPWFVQRGARVGRSLLIVGERLSPSPRTFRQRLRRTEDSAGQGVFPSIIAPPAEGCWRLSFTSGQTTGSLTVLVAGVEEPPAKVRPTDLPVIGCASRAEPSIKRFSRQRDLVRGPFALVTVARDLPRLSQGAYRPRGGRIPGIKLPVGLRTGHTATLSVAPSQRNHASLIYREETRDSKRAQEGDQAVAFKPCRPDTPAFHEGTVGPITGWAGHLILNGPRCIRLQVRVDGERQPDIRLPLGQRCR
jgi:hypothetical protein